MRGLSTAERDALALLVGPDVLVEDPSDDFERGMASLVERGCARQHYVVIDGQHLLEAEPTELGRIAWRLRNME